MSGTAPIPEGPPPGTAPGVIGGNVMHFARLLRRAGLPVGPGETIAAQRALSMIDIGNRTEVSYDAFGVGPQFGTTPLGNKTDTRTQLRTYTVDASATANWALGSAWTSRTTLGGQYVRDNFFQNFAIR